MGQPLLNPRLSTPSIHSRLATPGCKNSASTSYGVSLANRLLSPMVAIHHCIVHVPKTQFLKKLVHPKGSFFIRYKT